MIQRNSTRVVVNTIAQYTRTVINLILSLYSTRLILDALGLADYGIIALIGGVVSMLAFMTNAMVTTTQRFMSYHQTKSGLEIQQAIFSNSVLMHIGVSFVVLIILEIVGLFLFDGFLDIIPERLNAAKIIYQCTIAMILLSFITAPYKALLIAHENIVYISVVEVFDGIMKVCIAIALTMWGTDKLVTYGYLMLGINILNLLAFSIYDFRKYKECIVLRLKLFDRGYLKSMSSFIGWQLYSTGCVVGRTQGTAIIINKFFGTIVNAAFGIALQVSAAVNFISSSLTLAINPQIVKAEGDGNRFKMLQLAEVASKFSFLLLAFIVIPLLFILHEILLLWLGDVPEYAALFCMVILISSLIDQITSGLVSANQAIGNVGAYALTINTIKVLTLPILTGLLWMGMNLKYAIWCYAIIEFLCAILRLPFIRHTGGLVINQYIHNVFLKIILPTLQLVICCLGLYSLHLPLYLYIIGIVPIIILYGIIIYKLSLNANEREIINRLISSIKVKFRG